MLDFWISFRVHYDNQASYDRRYDALIKAIDDVATGGQWAADTSFVCIRSKYAASVVGAHLKKALNSTTDHLVMRRIGFDDTRYINDPGDGFLEFFPKAIKL